MGKDDYGLEDWKKLMTYSIEHSVWNNGNNDAEKAKVNAEWRAQYKSFVEGIVRQYKGVLTT